MSVPACVRTIGERAFYGCAKLRSAELAEGVEAIGESAFSDSGLESVRVPSTASVGGYAFCGCASLASAELPEGLSSIGGSAFSGSGLETVRVPSTASVGSCAFSNCDSLVTAEIAEGATHAGRPTYDEYRDEWYGSYSWGAFEGCDSLRAANVPGSMGAVGGSMFWGCTSLESVALGEGLASVEDHAFSSCPSLGSIELPGGISSIGDGAFSDCRALSAISLPEGLASVGDSAFSGCAPTAPVALPASLAEVGDGAFRWEVRYEWVADYDDGGSWVGDHRELVTPESYELRPATWSQYWRLRGNSRYIDPETTEVVAPEGVEPGELEWEWTVNADGTITITGCRTSVRNLTIPATIGGKTVTAIGQDAFSGSKALSSVVIPETVTTIQEGAFASCAALSSVLVPESVSEIADGAFDGSQKTTLVCTEGSPAAQYAEANGIPTTNTVPMSMALVTCDAEVPYADGDVRPLVTVRVGDKELSPTTDYTVSYASNDHLGTAMVSVTAREGSGYEGTQYRAFKVVPADLSSAALSGVADLTYTGRALTPVPVVRMGTSVLTLGTDFTLSYENNVDPGTATVTVNGKGNYAGTKTTTFRVVAKNCWVKSGSAWYYYNADGTAAKGWKCVGGKWYYLDPSSGAMRTGWLKSGSAWYYLTSSGAMATGWLKVGSTWYYLASSGAMATGWLKVGSVWYYFASSGAMKTGWQKVGSAWYYFNPSGAMATGWAKVGSAWYYFNGSGAMATGWLRLGSTWYYFSGSGAMVTGRQNIGGGWYTFASSGAWVA